MTVADLPSERDRIFTALTDHATRQLVIRQLREVANESNSIGDLALIRADWSESSDNWAVAARCVRTAQALAAGKPTDPEDYPLIRSAHRHVAASQTALSPHDHRPPVSQVGSEL